MTVKEINFAPEYEYADLYNIEAKTSVSRIAHSGDSQKYRFDKRPAFLSQNGATATQMGTSIHKVMELFDFEMSDNIEAELQRLLDEKYITKSEFERVNRQKLQSFFESEVFARLKKLPKEQVKREMRFITEMPATEIYSELSSNYADEMIILQGAVDLCFTQDEKIVILDFKTDRVDDEKELIALYSKQLDYYAKACMKIFGKQNCEKIIYSFCLEKEIKL